MASGAASIPTGGNSAAAHSKRRALIEIAIAYGLILAVIWTPRPLQRLLWLVAVAAIAAMTYLSFEGLKPMGLRRENFLRSLWVVGAALALAAIALVVAANLHTLLLQAGPIMYIKTYWAYAIWTFVQQFLMQCFFLLRLLRLLPGPKSAAFAAATLFALAHLPNPILAPVTLIWGFAACLLFLRYRNLYPLGMAHAIFGITLAITIPGPVIHNMRVGLGYLTYGHRHRPAYLFQPQGPDRVH
jgi:membrane protease YdiL (CAAX protease family)